MIIRLKKDAAATLEGADNLREFKVVAEAGMDRAALAKSLTGAGEIVSDEHAFISQDWIKRASGQSSSADWTANFGKMVDFAKSKGWVREDGAIRGHIETA